MDIQLEQSTPTNAIIKVKLTEADYQKEVQKKLKEYNKKVVLKGFRPGKVPQGLVRKMYGKSIISTEVLKIANQSLYEYLQKADLRLIGEPILNFSKHVNWVTDKEFELDYKIGLYEDFECNIEQLELYKYKLGDIDALLDESVEHIRKQYGKKEEVEEVGEGDTVYGTLSIKNENTTADDDKNIETQEKASTEANEEGNSKNLVEATEAEQNSYQAFIKLEQLTEEAQRTFIGSQKGSTVEFPSVREAFKQGTQGISTATGLPPSDVEALQGKLEFEIDKISRTTPRELNEELFEDLYGEGITTEEDFLARLREDIEKQQEEESQALLLQQIHDKLLDTVEIALPDDFLKEWLLISHKDKYSKEQIEQEYDVFASNTRWTLIRNKIAKEAAIEVKNEEIRNSIREGVLSNPYMFGLVEESEEKVEQIIQTIMENEEQVSKVAQDIFYSKVQDYIRSNVKTTDKIVSKEELEELRKTFGR